jgi:predicted DNA-binding transcriptional regulator YafY
MQTFILRLKRLDTLIHQKGTGTPAHLASKIGISERALYDYLKLMKELGAPIRYSRGRGSYYYIVDGSFHINFEETRPDLNWVGENQEQVFAGD